MSKKNAEKCPSNHLVLAIATTCCCCLPTGIPALIQACRVNSLFRRGQTEAAAQASRSARRWGIISITLGCLCWLLSVAGFNQFSTAEHKADTVQVSPEPSSPVPPETELPPTRDRISATSAEIFTESYITELRIKSFIHQPGENTLRLIVSFIHRLGEAVLAGLEWGFSLIDKALLFVGIDVAPSAADSSATEQNSQHGSSSDDLSDLIDLLD